MGYVLNQGFWSNRIVSKLVAAIAYETHYRAAKVERTCVFGSMIGHESLVSESKGHCWRTKFQTLKQRKLVNSAKVLRTNLQGLSRYYGVRQQYPKVFGTIIRTALAFTYSVRPVLGRPDERDSLLMRDRIA